MILAFYWNENYATQMNAETVIAIGIVTMAAAVFAWKGNKKC